MATLGFLRRDFDLFAIENFSTRMAKIDEFISPRLIRLGAALAPQLSSKLRVDFFPHVATHMRRTISPADETWVAFSPSRKGYQRRAYLALCVSNAGVHVRAVVKSDANQRARMARAIASQAADLEKSFRGTKIQQYQNWDCRKMPDSKAAGSNFFDGLGDALAQKTGAIDVGFGWLVRDALTVDRAEVLDAFRELEPLYRVLRSVES